MGYTIVGRAMRFSFALESRDNDTLHTCVARGLGTGTGSARECRLLVKREDALQEKRMSFVAPRPSASGPRAFGPRRKTLAAPRPSSSGLGLSLEDIGSASAFGLGPSGLRPSAEDQA